MKKPFRVMFLVFILAFVAANASALVINFDLQAWPGANPSSVTYSGQGAFADSGNDYWDSGGNGWEAYSKNDLTASDGTPTDVDFAVTPCKNLNWNDVGNDLLSDYQYIDTGSIGGVPTNPATITLSSLTPNTPYRLYLYAAGNAAGKGSKFTSNGVTKETTGTLSSDFIKNGNYVVLDTVSDATGTFTVTWELREGASQAALNGFQLTTPSNDFSGNGRVAMEDFAILSNDWQNDYDITDLQKIAEDWLMIIDVAFKSNPVIEMDAVEGIAFSSTLSDDLVFFDVSQLSLSKLSGPNWLVVDPDGELSGVPSASDTGFNSFTIQAEHQQGQSDQSILAVNVHGISSPYSTVDFDPTNELAAQFSNGGYLESASGGLYSSIGVTLDHASVTTLDGTQNRSIVFSNDGDTIRVGAFFKLGSFGSGTGQNNGQILHLGLSKGGSDDFANLPFSTIELTGTPGSGEAHFVERDSASTGPGTFTLTTDQWYYFETKFICRGGTAVDYDMTVYNASGDGTVGSMLASYATAQQQDTPELDDGAVLYGAFSGGTAFDHGAAGVMDNFYVSNDTGWVMMHPEEYPYALRNPLKGFRPNTYPSQYQHPYAGVTRCYIKWNELENDESDGVGKIKAFCDNKWAGVQNYNVKVIPRVYLDWDENPGNEYWPADMATGDYSSEQFKTRLRRLIQRLGQCWDNDPRVAWVQMGIIGYWGEHHHPSPTAEIQQLMGDEFTAAFKNKKVLVRHPWSEFTGYEFGGYWDSWAHIGQIDTQGAAIDTLNTTKAWWKQHVWEGEVAYNWGDVYIQPGDSPDDTLSDPAHRDWLIDTIRKLHCSGLGWVADYNQNKPNVVAGAEEVQRAFGYRYVLNEVRYPAVLTPGAEFSVHFEVTNVGSAPFYYNWPIEISLLDPATKAVVWNDTFNHCDITRWLPGDAYNDSTKEYDVPAVANTVSGTFQLPGNIANREYILALAILDPAGMLPSARFATVNYFNGGRHPIGKAGVGSIPAQYELSPSVFNDPVADNSLHYSLGTTP